MFSGTAAAQICIRKPRTCDLCRTHSATVIPKLQPGTPMLQTGYQKDIHPSWYRMTSCILQSVNCKFSTCSLFKLLLDKNTGPVVWRAPSSAAWSSSSGMTSSSTQRFLLDYACLDKDSKNVRIAYIGDKFSIL